MILKRTYKSNFVFNILVASVYVLYSTGYLKYKKLYKRIIKITYFFSEFILGWRSLRKFSGLCGKYENVLCKYKTNVRLNQILVP